MNTEPTPDGTLLSPPPCSAFYIVNGFDRPCERLIAERRADGLLYYVHPELRDQKSYHGMSAEESVPVADFGIQLSIEDGMLHGIQIYDSRAIYPDGRGRRWQGSSRFRVPLPNADVMARGRERHSEAPTTL